MKVRPNAPCPCGSGRKYKKCCLPKDRQAEAQQSENTENATFPPLEPMQVSTSASHESLLATTPTPEWPKLAREQLPQDLDSPEAFAQWLSPQQLYYLGTISNLAETANTTHALEALALFEAIPMADQQLLFPLMLKPGLLRILGREDEAYQYCFQLLCEMHSERRWVENGGLVWEWLMSSPSPENRQRVLDALRQLSHADGHAAPQLLLAQLLQQEDPPPQEEISSLQKAALRPERWRNYIGPTVGTSSHKADVAGTSIRPWLPQIAHGFLTLLEQCAADPEQIQDMGQSAQHILGFPWEQLHPSENASLEWLCLSLLRLNAHKEIRQLCERLQRRWPASGQLAFWQGYVAFQFGKIKQSIEHFDKAMQRGALERHHILNMLPILLSEEQLDASRQLLDLLRPAPTDDNPDVQEGDTFAELMRVYGSEPGMLDVMKMEIEYCRLAQDAERGLPFCACVLALEPTYAPARFYQATWRDERGDIEGAQASLAPLIAHQSEETSAFASLLLMGLAIKSEQFEQAAEQLKAILPKERAFALFEEDEWRRTFLLHWGTLLEHRTVKETPGTDSPTPLSLFEEALAYPPKEPIYGHILDHLCECDKLEEAREYGLRAIADCPDAPRLKFAMCQIEDYFGHWQESLAYIETIGFDWFVQAEHQLEGIYLRVRALLGLQRPLDALHFCEDWLPEIIADDTLRALRSQVVKEVDAQFHVLEAKVGAQAKHYQQLEETERLLARQREENRRRERAYQEILKKHEGLRQTMGRIPQRQPQSFTQALTSVPSGNQPTLAPRLQRVVEQLPQNLQQIFQSAQHLWHGLHAHPMQDHGPVVLQLARVVEGLVNRQLVDPLCAWTLSQGGSLASLPRPSLSPLKPNRNRLSLGDAASLLYHQREETEEDGSKSLITNPKSSSEHAALLASFWTQQALPEALEQYISQTLPKELQRLGKARNRAGHAHKPITRTEADTLRELVLGANQEPGILEQLNQLSQITTKG